MIVTTNCNDKWKILTTNEHIYFIFIIFRTKGSLPERNSNPCKANQLSCGWNSLIDCLLVIATLGKPKWGINISYSKFLIFLMLKESTVLRLQQLIYLTDCYNRTRKMCTTKNFITFSLKVNQMSCGWNSWISCVLIIVTLRKIRMDYYCKQL